MKLEIDPRDYGITVPIKYSPNYTREAPSLNGDHWRKHFRITVQSMDICTVIDEKLMIDTDLYQHPRSTMDQNAEFLTGGSLKVKLIAELPSRT